MEGLQQLYINAISMITPVGGNASLTSAAVKAGINAYRQSSVIGKNFTPLKIAPVPLFNEDFNGTAIPSEKWLYMQSRSRRMLKLAIAALTQILPSCPENPLPLFIAGPESTPSTAIDGYFLTLLAKAVHGRIDAASSRLIATGRPGGLQAIELAFRYLTQTGATSVLVGGVDSLIDLHALGVWTSEDRVSSINVVDGFTPGEGAAFILLSRIKNAESIGFVRLPGITVEPGHRYSEEPYRGDGLSSAFKEALHGYEGPRINTIFSGMNGESLGSKEHGVAVIRNQQHISPSFKLEHPADCFGDLGAAIGPVLVGLATQAFQTKQLGNSAIVCCSADLETRAACTVTAISTNR